MKTLAITYLLAWAAIGVYSVILVVRDSRLERRWRERDYDGDLASRDEAQVHEAA